MRPHSTPRAVVGAAGLAVVTIVTAGTALALSPSGGSTPTAPRPAGAVVVPHLIANTNAGCNIAQPKGYARCFSIVRTPASHVITPDAAGPPATALGPVDIQSAYKLPAAGGGGQTVAIVDAFGDSSAEADLATFRAQYGLAPCTSASGCFQKVDQTGGTNYPADNSDWAVETSLDLDAVSAVCPACNILLVEATDNGDVNLGESVDEAVALGAKFVSNSYGSTEASAETSDDPFYDHPGVAVTASTGDTGNVIEYPSSSDVVTAVGGTLLTRDASAARGWDESAWTDGGSGCSGFEPKPDFQANVTTGCDNRATADVAADADPNSGLAVFDSITAPNGESGWLQVGGTSLASPLVAGMYALAGSPQPGIYPVNNLYHDPNPTSDLFDVTQGVDGNCGNLLCQAGPGWDGPTGVGTPHGVAALNSGPQGEIAGQLTDKATGNAIAGATVTTDTGNFETHTDSTGHFELNVPATTYSLTVSDFGFQSAAQSGVTVIAGQTTTENFTLTALPAGSVSGKITDGSGQGWPLYAEITVPGTPVAPVFTNPRTGRYSLALPGNASYTLHVAPVYPGYQDSDVTVQLGATRQTQNVTARVDAASCTAPGYQPAGTGTDFGGWSGSTARGGWTISGTSARWRFDNPGDRTPPANTAGVNPLVTGGDDHFAVADAAAAQRRMNTTLTSPTINLSGQSAPALTFDSAYYALRSADQQAEVDLSIDGGHHWTKVWQQNGANAIGHVSIRLSGAAGKKAVRVRFRFQSDKGWYWAIDNVNVGTGACTARPGALLFGEVTGAIAGHPINGARISTSTEPGPQPWPTGISHTSGDTSFPAGLYWLFARAGRQHMAIRARGYHPAKATVNIRAGQIKRQDWTLTPAAR